MFRACLLLACAPCSSLVLPASGTIGRRELLGASVGGLAAVALAPHAAVAYVEVPLSKSRVGGYLEPFADVNRGFKLLKPTSWNQFEGESGAYDFRWVDLVEASSAITVSSNSYSGGSIEAIADVEKLGAKLAKSRGEVVSSLARITEGVLFYEYEFGVSDQGKVRELLALCVNKGRLYQISAKAPEKSWAKREALYRGVVASFAPKL